MKELVIYFGKQQDGFVGFNTADTIRCDIEDEALTVHGLTHEKWVSVKLKNGTKYINTDNILWFDIVDKEEKGGQE